MLIEHILKYVGVCVDPCCWSWTICSELCKYNRIYAIRLFLNKGARGPFLKAWKTGAMNLR